MGSEPSSCLHSSRLPRLSPLSPRYPLLCRPGLAWPGPKPQLQAPSLTDPLRAFQPLTTESYAGPTVLTPHLPLLVPHLREAPPPLSPGRGPETPLPPQPLRPAPVTVPPRRGLPELHTVSIVSPTSRLCLARPSCPWNLTPTPALCLSCLLVLPVSALCLLLSSQRPLPVPAWPSGPLADPLRAAQRSTSAV